MRYHRSMLACLIAFSSGPLLAATAVTVRYHVDGKPVARMTYNGGDGWKVERYWRLLDEKPWFAYDVTIRPNKPNGLEATLEGRVTVTLEAAGVEDTMATLKRLELVRPKDQPIHWHPTKAERDRLLELLRKQREPKDAD